MIVKICFNDWKYVFPRAAHDMAVCAKRTMLEDESVQKDKNRYFSFIELRNGNKTCKIISLQN